MLTRTSQYALRALIHLASDWPGESRSAHQIAEHADVPERYLSMILGELVQTGILKSARGRGGGFRLARPPDKISLFEIVHRSEPTLNSLGACLFGNMTCGDDNPCLAHNEWKEVTEAEQLFLKRKTLHDVSMERREVEARNEQRGKP